MPQFAIGLRFDSVTPESQAQTAAYYSLNGIDDYSEVGVGVSLAVTFGNTFPSEKGEPDKAYAIYASHNINISGFQTKAHAEQGALRQFMEEYVKRGSPDDARIARMMVVTTKGDLSLVCGPCLQYTRSVANFIGQDPDEIMYWAARPKYCNVEEAVNADAEWEFRKGKVGQYLSRTYAEGVMETAKEE